MDDRTKALRKIPQIDSLVGHLASDGETEHLGRGLLVEASRRVVMSLRARIEDGSAEKVDPAGLELPALKQQVILELKKMLGRRHRPVINATGILLHTGLGRAPLATSAREAAAEASRYAVVEVDPDSGERNRRESRVAELLCDLTGAEAATVVNNNAAATMLCLSALSAGQEIIVSRGELVEIGGGFRMPDVMEAAGCTLKEVGTTNRTYVRDFAAAVGPATGLILKVHTSNYRVEGFAHEPSMAELAELSHKHDLPFAHDLGSGLLREVSVNPLTDEPTVRESLEQGSDVVTFSGDKLLCGPQAGILVGRSDLIEKIRSHAMYRALRPDKLQLAALEETLLIWRHAPEGLPALPLYEALDLSTDDLLLRAGPLAEGLDRQAGVDTEIIPTEGFLGSGSAPARRISGISVAIRREEVGPNQLLELLRRGDTSVFARIGDDRVLLDMRTVLEDEMEALFDACVAACAVSGREA